jgi:hypothetical protein
MCSNSKIWGFELSRITSNRNDRNALDKLTENINIPDSRPNITTQQTKHLSKTVYRNIKNEKYKFNDWKIISREKWNIGRK